MTLLSASIISSSIICIRCPVAQLKSPNRHEDRFIHSVSVYSLFRKLSDCIFVRLLLAGISAVKIENFSSNGVYFQHVGDLFIQNETLIFINTIDFDILQKSIVSLGAKLDGKLPNGNQQTIADLYSQLVSNLSLIETAPWKLDDDEDFTFVANERKIELTGLKNQSNRITQSVIDFKVDDKQIVEKLKHIASVIEFLARCVGSKYVTLDILPRTNIKDIKHVSRRMLKLQHHRKGGLIIISVRVPVYDNEIFDLYKVINLPIIKNKNILSLNNDFSYMIVSKDKERYFSVKENLNNLPTLNNTLIYDDKNQHLIYSLNNSPCLFNIFTEMSFNSCYFTSNFSNVEVFERLQQNKFLFAVRDETPYTYSCGMNNNFGKQEVVQGTGFLYLDSFCDFRTNDNSLHTPRIDDVFTTKDKYDFNLGMSLNKTLTFHIKPVPEILPMKKVSTDFAGLNKQFVQFDDLLKKQDDLLNNLFELLPTDDPEGILNSASANGNSR